MAVTLMLKPLTSTARCLVHTVVVIGVASVLIACTTASTPQLRPMQMSSEASDNSSVYGLYLAGEAALDQGESQDAALYLGRASARAPDTRLIRERAFAASLVAGEIDRAAALAPADPVGAMLTAAPASSEPASSAPGSSAPAASSPGASSPAAQDEASDGGAYALGLLTRATVALADNHGRQAYALLSAAPASDHSAAVILLRPWAAAAAGDWAAATAPLAPQRDRALAAFGGLSRARLLERAGRIADAEQVYKIEAAQGGVFALAYGGFLERHGQRMDALVLYGKALAKDPADPAFLAAKARAGVGKAPPPAATIMQGAGQSLIGPAALLLSAKQGDAGLAYLRLSLKLDPELDEAWLLVGDALDASGDAPAARNAYAHVPPKSIEYPTAQDRLALNLQTSGDKTAALALARATVEAHPDDPQTLVVLADILRDDERYDDAVQVLDRLISTVGGDTATSWRLYYLRGASLERAGRWGPAQADLQQALKLKPDDPEVLNYLGFAWADRGEHLDQALDLLQKATVLEPQDGAIVDSLGWVHYKLGDYAKAVQELELAVSLDAADPEVNDHLGDAYWRTGRRLEAGYQWRRVLTLAPDASMRAAAETKLASGLQPRATATTAKP